MKYLPIIYYYYKQYSACDRGVLQESHTLNICLGKVSFSFSTTRFPSLLALEEWTIVDNSGIAQPFSRTSSCVETNKSINWKRKKPMSQLYSSNGLLYLNILQFHWTKRFNLLIDLVKHRGFLTQPSQAIHFLPSGQCALLCYKNSSHFVRKCK